MKTTMDLLLLLRTNGLKTQLLRFIGKKMYFNMILNKEILQIYLKKLSQEYFNDEDDIELDDDEDIVKETYIGNLISNNIENSIEYILKFKCKISEIAMYFVCVGNMFGIEYLDEKYSYKIIQSEDIDWCTKAARNGHLHILKYLHEKNIYWNANTCSNAALNGHLECLKYLHENGCPWDTWSFSYAAMKRNLECIKYLHKNECPRDIHACKSAVFAESLECLEYLHENGFPWNNEICEYAALNDKIDCLVYAHTHGCPWDSKIFEHVSNLNTLIYIYENKDANGVSINWTTKTCAKFAENDNLECLEYAHTKGCPWDYKTCEKAAENGYLNCLIYAIKNGCPIDKRASYLAAKNGHINILEYLHENGYALDKKIYKNIDFENIKKKRKRCIIYTLNKLQPKWEESENYKKYKM